MKTAAVIISLWISIIGFNLATSAQEIQSTIITGRTLLMHNKSEAVGVAIEFYEKENLDDHFEYSFIGTTDSIDYSTIRLKFNKPLKYAISEIDGTFESELPQGKYIYLITYIGSSQICNEVILEDKRYNLGDILINQSQDNVIMMK